MPAVSVFFTLCASTIKNALQALPQFLSGRANLIFFKKTLNRFLEAVYDLANDGSAKAK